MEAFYGSVPVIGEESVLLSVVNAYAALIWGGSDAYTVTDMSEDLISTAPLSLRSEPLSSDQALLDMETMAQRYAYENDLMDAVAHGQIHKVELFMSNFSEMKNIEKSILLVMKAIQQSRFNV
jgi:hypothetical protein